MSESVDQMQARIQSARREAEGLKDKIKRKKDELADGSRKYIYQTSNRLFETKTITTNQLPISREVSKKPYPRTK